MRKLPIFLIPVLLILTIHCGQQEGEPFICHLYGYTQRIRVVNDSIPVYDTLPGINGLILRIYDINPYDVNLGRLRYDTTVTRDSVPGCFEMDSVCYGTTTNQGNLVSIGVNATENPGWNTQYRMPYISGEVDTVLIYLFTNN
jgi:hypothetical protein